MPLELALFAAALALIWMVRRWQLRSLNLQESYLRAFAEGVNSWREQPNIPNPSREVIERLVRLPINQSTMRRFTLSIMRSTASIRNEDNPFIVARRQLTQEQAEAFDWLLTMFFLAMTYSDWLTGWFLRRARVGGLSKQTAAGVAIETIFSSQMGRAAHA